MFESPSSSGAVRPLPPNPPDLGHDYQGNQDGPPLLPPILSLNDDSMGPPGAASGGFGEGTSPQGLSSLGATPPQSPGFPASKKANRNPLTDLIDSEEQFVALMGAIIRKVASAWSRTNFPPPELDRMFRGIEGVFKASRTFLGQLKEIGPNPSTPKALGDLLMRWVTDLEPPYTKYCEAFAAGFDQWEPVQSNPKLAQVLSDLSESIPTPSNVDPPVWTMDALFLLPRTRLKYYKKLYARLLKSTSPGRSDHKMLLLATETLDALFAKVESRLDIMVGQEDPSGNGPLNMSELERDLPPPPPFKDDARDSYGSSGRASSRSSADRVSRDTAQTSAPPTSPPSMYESAMTLERRLSTEKVLDLFTMEPRQCRLQISPPNLTFTREIRIQCDCTIYFTPKATGQQLAMTNAHIILLTDLFLVCEKMTKAERDQMGLDGPNMWLSFPPLAGKVLKVSDIDGGPGEYVLEVLILKKETFYIHFDSPQLKEQVRKEFFECKEAGASLVGRANTGPVPPVPPLLPGQNGPNRPPSAPNGRRLSPQADMQRPPGHMSDPPSMRFQDNGQAFPARNGSLRDPALNGLPPPPMNPNGFGMGMPGMGLGPGMGMPPPGMGGPLGPGGPGPGPGQAPFMPPPRGSSAANGMPPRGPPMGGPPPFLPGQPPHLGGFPPPMRQPSPGIGGPMGPMGGMPPPDMGGPGGFGPPGPMQRPVPPFAGPNPNYSPRMSMAPSLAMRPQNREPDGSTDDHSPPTSPVPTGPTRTVITAEMRCKVFLQQQHQQWKSLGSGKLKLYHTQPTNVKQLVVESDSNSKNMLMSLIVLTDGVERVGRTGVAIEMSDQGLRTGVVYMVQLRNETSTKGLFDSLLAGSDRTAVVREG